jgi:hypothetical protein
VIGLATINCVLIPIDVGFKPETFESIFIKFINGLIDSMFLLDIIISFRTTFNDLENGREVKIPRKMAVAYLKSDFTVDALSTIPFDYLASLSSNENGGFKVLGALKLTRILRINKLISFMRSNEQVKATLKLIKLVFFLVMYLHCFGCLWWLVVTQLKIWVPPWDFNGEDYY